MQCLLHYTEPSSWPKKVVMPIKLKFRKDLASKINLSPSLSLAAACRKAVILLLLIHCIVAPIACGYLCLVLVLLCST